MGRLSDLRPRLPPAFKVAALTRTRERHDSDPPPPLTPIPLPVLTNGATSARGGSGDAPSTPPPAYDPTASTSAVSTVEKPPSIMVMVRQDYVQARLYVKEMDYKLAMRKALRKHLYKWYALAIIIIAITILLTTKHETVVDFLHPVTEHIRHWPVGWLIPIALLVIVSFPPLLGHEIIGILCGLVWGLGVGFGILAAGTFLGEVAVWVAFKWLCTARAAKFERKNKLYATLTQLIRDKSFMFVLVLRFSAVPGHITTAVSASAGASFYAYLAAAFLTLPKQFTIVYLGKAFGQKSLTNTVISVTATVATLIGTIVAAIYIYYQMRLVMIRQALSLPTANSSGTDSNLGVDSVTSQTRAEMRMMSEDVDRRLTAALHSRRPWLFARDSSYSSNGAPDLPTVSEEQDAKVAGRRTPMRTWSMPGHLSEDELRDWQEELRSQQNTPQVGPSAVDDILLFTPVFDPTEPGLRHSVATQGKDDPFDLSFSSIGEPDTTISSIALTVDDVDADSVSGRMPSTATPTPGPSRPPTRPVSRMGRSDSKYEPDVYTPRAMSLDMERPLSRNVMGGREIADDADLYAIAKGAKRPEYGRMRGDSRAALLGRPRAESDLSTRSFTLSGSFDDAYLGIGNGRRRGSGSPAPSAAPSLSASTGSLRPIDRREYGRVRGESGAALLGRPEISLNDNPKS